MDACRQCLLAGRLGILTLLPGAVPGKMGLVVVMAVGTVALEVLEAVAVMAAVVDLWVPPRHLETGGVARGRMHTEEAAAAEAALEVGETATSGLDSSMDKIEKGPIRIGDGLDLMPNGGQIKAVSS